MVKDGTGRFVHATLGMLVAGVVVLLVLQVVTLMRLVHTESEQSSPAPTRFQLLEPGVSEMPMEDFLTMQDTMTVRYAPLRNQVVEIVNRERVYCTFYFEDLVTGSWVGIHEKEMFRGASLLKLQKMTAILKKIELGDLTFDTQVDILPGDLSEGSGPMAAKGANRAVSVRTLLENLICYSDNTAAHVLARLLSPEELYEASLGMGLRGDMSGQVSLKAYANILRSLYLSSYLRRPFSEYGLKLMKQTVFDDQIPAGVPSDIVVAHKVGFWVEEKLQSDCGIVYAQSTPYIICVMCKDVPKERASAIMKEISNVVYKYVQSQGEGHSR